MICFEGAALLDGAAMIVGQLHTLVVHLLQELYRWFTGLLVGA